MFFVEVSHMDYQNKNNMRLLFILMSILLGNLNIL